MDNNPISLPFSLDQNQIDLALDNELAKRRQTKGKYAYTNGRAPKGLFATQTINEETIRQAVINHARSLVQSQFQYFSVEFVATRGDDGLTAQIIASTHEIVPEEDQKEEPAPTPRRVSVRTTAKDTPAAEPAVTAPAEVQTETVEASEDAVVETEVSPTAEPEAENEGDSDGGPSDAPWENKEDGSDEQVAEDADPVNTAASTDEEAPREPRARLFASLRKPTNEPTE